MAPTTVLAPDRSDIDASWTNDRPVVSPAALTAALGWELKPEGLCRGDQCVPVADRAGLEMPDGIDLLAAAAALGRPTATDADANLVAVGVPATDRAMALRDKQAPNFTLDDLDGEPQSFWGWRGKKKLLVAFSSW